MYLIFVLTSIAVVAMAILPLIETGQPRERVRPTRSGPAESDAVERQLAMPTPHPSSTVGTEVDEARTQAA